MARRRTLEAPDANALAEIEKGFAAKPGQGPLTLRAPIAQVAAEAAQVRDAREPDARAAEAKGAQEAASWRTAQAAGRVIEEIPLDRIDLNHLTRDRIEADAEATEELVASIRSSGQRLPVEVVALPDGRYGLISGWRRVRALAMLAAEGQGPATARAVVRPPAETGAAYAAMVEENEIRAQLTPYERGRIAAVAAQTGAFRGTEAAVDAIFAAASKAKRSKIRSFALVHYELGDLLSHGRALSESAGLRIAGALRAGFATKLRAALERGHVTDAAGELAVMEPILRQAEAAPATPAKGGRPKQAGPLLEETFPDGRRASVRREGDALVLRLQGWRGEAEAEARRLIDMLRRRN